MEFFKNDGARTGLYFGATSGVITTLGLLTGPLPIIAEHLGIAFLVVLLPHLIGAWVSSTFG